MERPQFTSTKLFSFHDTEPKTEYLRTPGHRTDFWKKKNPLTYFHLQMNTVAVIFAQICFCFRNVHCSYMLVVADMLYRESLFLPLLLCHTSYSIKCDRQLKIYLQTQLQFALNDRFTWLCFRHRDKMNHSSVTQNRTFHTENLSSTIFVRSRARNRRQKEFYLTAACHMKLEIPTTTICN
jgi:hypothetical protein